MGHWKVSKRLSLIALVAGLLMVALAGANWMALLRLHHLGEEGDFLFTVHDLLLGRTLREETRAAGCALIVTA